MQDEAGNTREIVRKKYADIAADRAKSCCGSSSCCGTPLNVSQLAQNIGYEGNEIHALPQGVNMGLSCGNPVALASLHLGETVLDIGCGGGFDVFQAGPRVGAQGRVIGVDMTEEMLAKAQKALDWYRGHTGLDNVEFRQGTMEALPLPDNSVDVVLSNCVINLSPDKRQAWKEIFRVLRPGGRAAISDIALLRPLPQAVKQSVEALVGCVAGALLLETTLDILAQCGFAHVSVKQKPDYVASLHSEPLYQDIQKLLPVPLHEVITSVEISATKQEKI